MRCALVIGCIGVLGTCTSKGTANHLLLVEDDIDTRELVAGSLRGAGYDVEEARDGRDALAAIERECPSLLITDCNMPNMSGNELLEQLALDERWCSIPAIVVSAVEQPLLPANVLVFLPKPFTMRSLEAAIRDCLRPPCASPT
jgi:CheY-like chemotaxis protein